MSIKIYNTLTRQKEPFEPLEDKKVKMYVCGPTVWSTIHIGNARTFLFFDVVRRYLQARGYEVRFVENFTDVDDKLIRKAQQLNWTVPQVAEHYIEAFRQDTAALGIRPADIHPRVTEHIPDIIRFIEQLMERGVAYAVDGNVYFRVSAFPNYGRLSRHSMDDLVAGARVEVDEKKENPLDFALWKKAKPGEIAWDSPWGEGRPGWHIECSAMAIRYLGETLDIHAGGSDLRFPHHENEIAQSEALTGRPFARYWMHTAHVTVENEKMSKSLGNVLDVRDLLQRVRPEVVRFWMLSTHYRTPMQYSEAVLEQAARGWERIETMWRNLEFRMSQMENAEGVAKSGDRSAADSSGASGEQPRVWETIQDLKARFDREMADDFNTADALAVVFEAVKELNRYLEQPDVSRPLLEEWKRLFTDWDDVLGLLPFAAPAADDDEEIRALIEEREKARAKKDWATSDRIREELQKRGIVVQDTPQGVRWYRKK
ncbi:MAG: cysteine--tRNA ligase [Bacillaceae bacterium G1]|nr:cysteine--tRNA ligase [Bacillota bacterium]OJF16384.1 MAG: cysteine--tRNA ligase [Bacillaceae bacterium G1]